MPSNAIKDLVNDDDLDGPPTFNPNIAKEKKFQSRSLDWFVFLLTAPTEEIFHLNCTHLINTFQSQSLRNYITVYIWNARYYFADFSCALLFDMSCKTMVSR